MTITASELLLAHADLDAERLIDAVAAVQGKDADFADLYLERTREESWSLNEGRIDAGGFGVEQGMALRAVSGEAKVLACADLIQADTLAQLGRTVAEGLPFITGGSERVELPAPGKAEPRYAGDDPLALPEERRIAILQHLDERARRDQRVFNVRASLSMEHAAVMVCRGDGEVRSDLRPLVGVNVAVFVKEGDRVEIGGAAKGRRGSLEDCCAEATLDDLVDEALRLADVNLRAQPAPGGMLPVVLGNAWAGVLLHEAVGHGLEGDFNRKGQSAFSGRIGERVAPAGVTVVDDGTLPDRRGSLSCDDEGTPSARNVLIEDGILKGYMQDAVNAALTGVPPTGNGRRESYRHEPMPRMTNTFMLAGELAPEEIIASVERGIYCKSFGGGSVDITNGNFNFNVSEAYLIEKGKPGPSLKDVTIIGNGPESMMKMSMVGNDLELDPGQGMCGKNGQWVPVGVGQPHCKVDEMLVGGTEV